MAAWAEHGASASHAIARKQPRQDSTPVNLIRCASGFSRATARSASNTSNAVPTTMISGVRAVRHSRWRFMAALPSTAAA